MAVSESKEHPGTAASSGPGKASETSWYVSAGVVLMMVVLFAPGARKEPWQETFATYFLAIVMEGVPFILLGAVVSGMMETFLPADFLPRFAGRLGRLGVPVTVLLAPFFPICECGVVMVARGLLRKGLPLGHTLAYVLAAPILNPTVMLSTWFAFWRLDWVGFRALGGFLIPVALGYLFSLFRPEQVFLPEFLASLPESGGESHGVDGGVASSGGKGVSGTVAGLLRHVRKDFIEMLPFFLFGVMIASGMKTFVDVAGLGHGPVSGIATMMLAAFVFSLCSEADAFVAASFTQFDLPARMGFLVYGPMFDIKLILMYRTVFRTWFIVVFAAAVTAGAALYAGVLEMLW